MASRKAAGAAAGKQSTVSGRVVAPTPFGVIDGCMYVQAYVPARGVQVYCVLLLSGIPPRGSFP